jgi:hypothetical protein
MPNLGQLKEGNNALVAGAAAAIGAAVVLGLAHLWRPAMCRTRDDGEERTKGTPGSLWTHGFSHPDGTPDGFTMRTAVSSQNTSGSSVACGTNLSIAAEE